MAGTNTQPSARPEVNRTQNVFAQNLELESKLNSLKRDDSELIQLNDYIVRKGVKQIDDEGPFSFFKHAIPSIILLLISFIIDVAYVPVFGHVANNFSAWLFPDAPPVNTSLEPVQLWWYPVVIYIIFVFFALRSSKNLKDEFLVKGPSEPIINKVIEKYSGLIDALGTALPLLGAAILLVSIKVGPQLFLGFSVPFEIKSIIILALAKLFGAVFEAQGLRYQKITEEVKNVETEYFYQNKQRLQNELIFKLNESNKKVMSELIMAGGAGMKQFNKEEIEYIYKLIKMSNDVSLEFAKNMNNFKNTLNEVKSIRLFDERIANEISAVASTMSGVATVVQKSAEYSNIMKQQLEAIHKLGTEINSIAIKLPDEKALKELQMTAHFLSDTINHMKDANAQKSLENLAYIAGKR